MSIVTFSNNDKKETGQTLSVAAIATIMAIEHNYKILILSTDFNDRTMESMFFKTNGIEKNISSLFQIKADTTDVSNGIEGLVRLFASNRAEASLISTYARPIFTGRLDLISSPRTKEYSSYQTISNYFSQVAELANSIYDLVIIDLSRKVPRENIERVYNVSTMICMGLPQNRSSIEEFRELENENKFYQQKNIMLTMGKYNDKSRYTAKNTARYLGKKVKPFVVPYCIRFADSCSESEIVDYILKIRNLSFMDGEDGKFYQSVKDSAERLDYQRRVIDFGIE